MQDNSSTDKVTSVTYGGTAVPAVSGGLAAAATGEPRACKTFFLGSVVVPGPQLVVVNRVNDATVLYAVAITVTAARVTEVYSPGIVLQQTVTALAEQSVNDGSVGVDSVRFGGGSFALNGAPGAGANSTGLQTIDFGPSTAKVVRQTTAGQGSLPVGFSAASDDVAAVYLAVREAATSILVSPAVLTLTGKPVTVTTKHSVTHGHVALAGQSMVVSFGTTIHVDLPTAARWADPGATWSSPIVAWSEGARTSLALSGSAIVVTTSMAVTPGALTLTGQTIATSRKTSITHGAVTYTGQESAVSGGTTFLVEVGALTLAGSVIPVAYSVAVTAGAITMTGVAVLLGAGAILVDPGVLTLAGGTFSVTFIVASAPLPPGGDFPAPELRSLHKLRKHYGLERR